jgi:preprotein translocase subunit SecA
MNRCINALRKLQTERGIRSQAFPETDVPPGLGLMDIRQVAKTKPMDTDAEPEPAPAAAAPAATPTGFDALMALADKQLAQRYRDYGMAAFTGAPTPAAPVGQVSDLPSSPKHVSDLIRTEAQSQTNNQWSMGSNCKPAAAATPATAKPAAPARITPRNAPCPCKSGQKFKRCCGKEAPTTLNRVA